MYSEKAAKFCKISTLLLTVTTKDKCEVEISQNSVAFSEYMNFIKNFQYVGLHIAIKVHKTKTKKSASEIVLTTKMHQVATCR